MTAGKPEQAREADELGLMTLFDLVPVLWRCEWCGTPVMLTVVIKHPDEDRVCAECWKAAGQPGVGSVGSIAAIHRAELRARERMLARGGEDRYRVLAGKS